MQNQKKQIAKGRKERRLLQRPLEYLNNHYDPLWYQTPELGNEGLIAMIDSEKKLQTALRKGIIKKKNKLWRREM